MENNIDCLILGHNNTDIFNIVDSGSSTGYKDFKLGFITYKDVAYSFSDLYNLFALQEQKIDVFNTFSNTVAYLCTFLNKNNLKTDFINSFNTEKKSLAKKLSNPQLKTVVITTTYYVSVNPIVEIIDFIREHNKEVKIIVGGPFVTTFIRTNNEEQIEYLFKHVINADFYINSSQGELTLSKLIHSIKNNDSFKSIHNIYYNINNEFGFTGLLTENNLLKDNLVDWKLFGDADLKDINVRTAISCAFSCAFCGFPKNAGKYQTLSVEDIEKELDSIKELGSVRFVNFVDDTFNVPPKRFKEILQMMIKNEYNFKWYSYIRCQYLDEEIVGLMKESGCMGSFLGIESGSESILERMNKKSNIEEYKKGIALLKKAGILTFGSFIAGFPGENFKSIQETIEFIETSGLDFYRIQAWFYEHITPIYDDREEFNIKGEGFEWSHSSMNSNIAFSLIDRIFMNVKNVVWIPQYNFDFISIMHLLLKGYSTDNIKKMLQVFNEALKEKITNSSSKNVSNELIEEFKSSCEMIPCKEL